MQSEKLDSFTKDFPADFHLHYPANNQLKVSSSSSSEYDLYMKIMSEPASRIYSGVKKYELRKYIPKHKGLLFLFETNGVKAVTGCFYFRDYIAKPIPELWSIVGEKATKKERFDNYFQSKEFGVALIIEDFQKFSKPITLNDMYRNFTGFPQLPHPYVYLYTPVGGALSTFLRSHASEILNRIS